MSVLTCSFCGRENEAPKGAFRAVCEGCGRFLHSCLQCRIYNCSSGRCSSRTAEEPGDREHGNYCEEFEPLNRKRGGEDSPRSADAMRRFSDLFGSGSPGDGGGGGQ